jgi:hypothetical protein
VTEPRYVKPTRGDAVFNAVVGRFARWGLPVAGSRLLAVRGRSSGEWRTTPVNPIRVGGERYLVAPRGEAQWVRNIRVSGGGELRAGRRVERFVVAELPDDAKLPVLREYLRVFGWEVGRFFEGVDAKATDETLRSIAPGFPVFRISVNE